jgi:hypothetical protein
MPHGAGSEQAWRVNLDGPNRDALFYSKNERAVEMGPKEHEVVSEEALVDTIPAGPQVLERRFRLTYPT